MKKAVIGLVGAKLSGKSTAVSAIQEIIPEAVEVALANSLQTVCSEAFQIPLHMFTNRSTCMQELDILVYLNRGNILAVLEAYQLETFASREFMQSHVGKVLVTPEQLIRYVGTEVLRVIKPDAVCQTVLESTKDEIIIVPDIKFPDEIQYFKTLDTIQFFSLYIQNTRAEQVIGNRGDISGKYIKAVGREAQFTVHNNGSLDYFQDLCKHFARGLKNG